MITDIDDERPPHIPQELLLRKVQLNHFTVRQGVMGNGETAHDGAVWRRYRDVLVT